MPAEPLEWSIPAPPSSPAKKAGVAATIAAVLAAGAWGAGQPLLGIAGALVIVLAVQEAFLPVRYRLDERGPSRRCGIGGASMGWADVRRAVPVEGGIRLSPFANPSPREATRGVLLKFASNEDAVWARIRESWQQDESGLAGALEGGRGAGGDPGDRRLDPSEEDGGARDPGAGDA